MWDHIYTDTRMCLWMDTGFGWEDVGYTMHCGKLWGSGDIWYLAILRFFYDCSRSQIPKRTLGQPSEALKSHGIVKIVFLARQNKPEHGLSPLFPTVQRGLHWEYKASNANSNLTRERSYGTAEKEIFKDNNEQRSWKGEKVVWLTPSYHKLTASSSYS